MFSIEMIMMRKILIQLTVLSITTVPDFVTIGFVL